MPFRGSDRGARMGKLTDTMPWTVALESRVTRRKIFGLLLIVLLMLSCSGYPVKGDRPRGVYHRVKSGETLSSIARAYRVDLQELAEINNIDSPGRIEVDSVIFIPDASQIVDDVMTAARPSTPQTPSQQAGVREPVKPPTPLSKTEPPETEAAPAPVPERRREPAPVEAMAKERQAPAASETDRMDPQAAPTVKPDADKPSLQQVAPREQADKTEQLRFDKRRFVWPVQGKIVSQFGIQRDRTNNNGIRIAAGEGTAVKAAADGFVEFSAPIKDYGETVIIRHQDHYATVYSHLGIRTVQREIRVKKGDRIAFLGKGEGGEEPYLHFEIRHRNKARNPLFFLP